MHLPALPRAYEGASRGRRAAIRVTLGDFSLLTRTTCVASTQVRAVLPRPVAPEPALRGLNSRHL